MLAAHDNEGHKKALIYLISLTIEKAFLGRFTNKILNVLRAASKTPKSLFIVPHSVT